MRRTRIPVPSSTSLPKGLAPPIATPHVGRNGLQRNCNYNSNVWDWRTMTALARHFRSRWLQCNSSMHIYQPETLALFSRSLRQNIRGFHVEFRLRDKAEKPSSDPKINDLGRAIEDDFGTIRANYGMRPVHSPLGARRTFLIKHP